MDTKENKILKEGTKVSWTDIKQSGGHFKLSKKEGSVVEDKGGVMIEVKYRNGRKTLVEKNLIRCG